MDSYEPSDCHVEVGGHPLNPRGYFAEAMEQAKRESDGPRWEPITFDLREPVSVVPFLDVIEQVTALRNRIHARLELVLGKLLGLGVAIERVRVICWRDEALRRGVRVDGVELWEARGDMLTGEVTGRWLADPERFAR